MVHINKELLKKIGSKVFTIVITAAVAVSVTLSYVSRGKLTPLYLKYIIDTRYYGEINDDEIDEYAMSAMLAALGDRHTYFVGSEYGFDNYQGQTEGHMVGIGMLMIRNKDGNCVIARTYKNSPAKEAGLLHGDIISKVDGKNALNTESGQVADMVKGEEGTKVKITVLRNGSEKTFEVTRKEIDVQSVYAEKIENIGYLQITGFDEDTDKEMEEELEKLKGISGLIVDLRDNGGGLLQTAVNMLNDFIDEGTLITAKYRKKEVVYKARNKKKYDMPLVVLVNGNSASASELFSAAIKENGRGKIVGTNTYGKGSIQQSFSLPNNCGAHITVGRFYSPKGNEINEVGVKPDTEVKNSSQYDNTDISFVPHSDDVQLQKALEMLG